MNKTEVYILLNAGICWQEKADAVHQKVFQ